MNKKVGIVSLGCDKNLVETEKMLGLIVENGFTLTNSEKDADAIIVNTCCFIETAKQESINTIKEMINLKGGKKKIIVTGCLAERYKKELLKEIPEIAGIVGTGSYHQIISVLNSIFDNEKGFCFGDINKSYEIESRIQSTPKYTAYLKIAEGCSNHCTYCVIPSLRGKYRSRSIENILSEAKSLVENGVKELILIAQDTTRYGEELYNRKMLSELLLELCSIEKLEWIRILYCYPEGITDELIKTIKNNDKICNYLDIPIQHCNDKILKLMGRRSSKTQLMDLFKKLRSEIPDIVIRTSLIVGFPGEGKKEFEDLYEFLQTMKLNKVGVFKYSREEGTPAAKLEHQVDEKTKEERYDYLMKMQQSISKENNEKMLGKILRVLVEGTTSRNQYIGRSYIDSPQIDGEIYFSSDEKLFAGQYIYVKIVDVSEYDMIGEKINELGK